MKSSRRHFISIFLTSSIIAACGKGGKKETEPNPNPGPGTGPGPGTDPGTDPGTGTDPYAIPTSDDILQTSFTRKIVLKPSATLLFYGDSITEWYRDKTVTAPNDPKGLGEGFVSPIANAILKNSSFSNGSIYNRGVAGDVTNNLTGRWDTDGATLKPDIISILIGVNDLRTNVTPVDYFKNYDNLIKKIKEKFPNAELILCEPFILPNVENYDTMKPNFLQYRKVIRLLAQKYDTVFVPFFDAINGATATTSPEKILSDGFHPAPLAVDLLGKKWLAGL